MSPPCKKSERQKRPRAFPEVPTSPRSLETLEPEPPFLLVTPSHEGHLAGTDACGNPFSFFKLGALEDTITQQQLRNATRIARRVDSPFIVRTFEVVYQHGESVYLCHEPMPRGSLAQSLTAAQPEKEALRLFTDVACGIRDLHRANIVHGSLDFRNILIDANNRLKLVAFEFAGATDDRSVDIAALGNILSRLLLGPALASQHEQISEQTQNLVEQMLSEDPQLRPSIDDICSAVEAASLI